MIPVKGATLLYGDTIAFTGKWRLTVHDESFGKFKSKLSLHTAIE